MGKIISFSGRMKSGKSELAKICEQYGYQKLYFALPLKQLCADILDISIDELNRAKNEGIDIGLTIGKDICEILSEETEIPLDAITETCDGVLIANVRQMLQFIGTDLIRKYNRDWHVNRIRAMINKDKNYVLDDVRFPNEKKMIEELGGECWFIVRPTLDNISNHESETSLTWKDCWNKVIINDTTLSNLQFKWETFISNYVQSCTIRDREFNRILEDGTKDKITPLSIYDMMLLHKALFTYVPKTYVKENIKDVKLNDDKTVFITYQDDSMEIVENPLNIEDLKAFL